MAWARAKASRGSSDRDPYSLAADICSVENANTVCTCTTNVLTLVSSFNFNEIHTYICRFYIHCRINKFGRIPVKCNSSLFQKMMLKYVLQQKVGKCLSAQVKYRRCGEGWREFVLVFYNKRKSHERETMSGWGDIWDPNFCFANIFVIQLHRGELQPYRSVALLSFTQNLNISSDACLTFYNQA